MKIFLLLPVFLFSTLTLSAQPNLQQRFTEAKNAYAAHDYAKFYTEIVEAHKLHPYHQTVLYYAGLASALTNRPEEASRYLTQAINIKADYDLQSADLKSLEGRSDFEKLKKLQGELMQKEIHSDTAFVIHDRSLHLEAITSGESKNVFYAGSIHKRKIIRIDEKGNFTDFTKPAQDGLASVFSVKVDAKRRILWACSSPIAEMENFDSTIVSGVYAYDVSNGKLLRKILQQEKGEFVFGDLTLDPSGNVFVSDSKNNIIFKVNEQQNKLEHYFTSDEFWSLQGITFSDDGQYLFIADYIKGLYRLDTQTKKLIKLSTNFDASIKSIDGLTFYHNSLIAIQNLVVPMRVTQYQLNPTQDALTGYKILDRAHPAFNEPTIGCVVNDTFYYVANSLWSGYTDDHQLKPVDQLQDVVILKVKLR